MLVILTAIATAGFAFLAYSNSEPRKQALYNYAPGPKPKFLLGNALDMPKKFAYKVFREWGKTFKSDILHVTAMGKHILILNSRTVAEDLMEKRAKFYNDRPDMPLLETLGWSHNVSVLPYGDSWRQHRRVCQQHFHKGAAKLYHPIQVQRVQNFLLNLLHDPDRFELHSKWLSISATMKMMYGYEPESMDDSIIQMVEESTSIAAQVLAVGGSIMNIIPILRHIPPWVPGATGQKMAARCKSLVRDIQEQPMDRAKVAFKEGKAATSLITNVLQNGAGPEEETIASNVAWTTYGAASETTIAATGFFFYYMAKNPDVQRKAQEEIDRIVGCDRLPNFADRESGCLPYLEAIYREVLRSMPPLPLGLPHGVTQDDIYEGYFFPKDSIILPNIFAMTHDEKLYPDPFSFRPERFFDSEGNLNNDSRVLAYGFGRRICPGKIVASSVFWLTIAACLACYKIVPKKDEHGNEIEISDEYEDLGLTVHKTSFECSITPRSGEARKLIESCSD